MLALAIVVGNNTIQVVQHVEEACVGGPHCRRVRLQHADALAKRVEHVGGEGDSLPEQIVSHDLGDGRGQRERRVDTELLFLGSDCQWHLGHGPHDSSEVLEHVLHTAPTRLLEQNHDQRHTKRPLADDGEDFSQKTLVFHRLKQEHGLFEECFKQFPFSKSSTRL